MDVEAVGCSCEAVARRRRCASSAVGTSVQERPAVVEACLARVVAVDSGGWFGTRCRGRQRSSARCGCWLAGAPVQLCPHTDKVLMMVEQWWSAMDKQAVDGG